MGRITSDCGAEEGRSITVYPAPDVYADDIKLVPADDSGSPADAFSIGGTVYLPVCTIAEALNIPVYCDKEANAVYLGKHSGTERFLLSECPPYQTFSYEAPECFVMAGKRYYNGFCFNSDGYAYINTNGLYSRLSFTLGHVDGTGTASRTVRIYLDGKIAYKCAVSGDMYPQNVTMRIKGARQMKIVLDGRVWNDTYGFGEIKVS